jgi:alkylation response protein AidB-like acyl-CoA dehydrogenase
MLAEIAVSIRACRLLTHEVAWKADRGEASLRDAAMVKLCGTQLVLGVADRVAHVYGGPPYVAGLAMERMSLDPLAASATRTSLELQRSLIAREVLKGMKP